MQKWWREVVRDWELQGHHQKLLESACRAWDSAEAARFAVAQDGRFVLDNKGVLRAHPGCQSELVNRKLFVQCLRELGLDVKAPSEAPRAPYLPAYREVR
jgi:phage terminase small subunit